MGCTISGAALAVTERVLEQRRLVAPLITLVMRKRVYALLIIER